MSNDVFHVILNLLSVSKEYSDFQLLPAFPPPFGGGGGRCAVCIITELPYPNLSENIELRFGTETLKQTRKALTLFTS